MDRFRARGHLGPFPLFAQEEMAEIRSAIEDVLASDAPGYKVRDHNRHLDSQLLAARAARHHLGVDRHRSVDGGKRLCAGDSRVPPQGTGSVRDAVQNLKEGSYELILMDLNLPDARGEAAISFLREVMKDDTPVIVISSEIKVDTVFQLQPFGISAFVAKSEDFVTRLSEEVGKVLGG